MEHSAMQRMLRTIESECVFTRGLTGISSFQSCVYEAMAATPREDFVPDNMKAYAYDNTPLPIGNGQTISQPYIVALMTDLLRTSRNHIILEIGTGSGYQAAILARLVKKVFTLEIVPELASLAADRLKRLGHKNIEVRAGDGYNGLPDFAPYDGIIVTAAAGHIPPPLVEQLKPGGRLVIPVGHTHIPQELLLLEKDQAGSTHTRNILSVSFVPLTGKGLES